MEKATHPMHKIYHFIAHGQSFDYLVCLFIWSLGGGGCLIIVTRNSYYWVTVNDLVFKMTTVLNVSLLSLLICLIYYFNKTNKLIDHNWFSCPFI